MKYIKYFGCAIAALSLTLAVGVWGCGHSHEDHDHDGHEDHDGHVDGDAHEEDEHSGHGDEVTMSHEAMGHSGIVVERVEPGTFRESVKAGGVIEAAPGGTRIVSAPMSGVVSFGGGIVPGAGVKAGERLFAISSKGLETGDAVAAVGIDKEIAEKELRRAEELVKDHLISQRDYDRIRSDYDKAVAGISTVAATGRTGMSVGAPIGGYILDVLVRPGQFVNTGDALAVVAENRRVILRADLSERHRAFVSLISGANIAVPGESAIPLARYGVRILTKTPSASASHYLPVYLEFDNPGTLSNGQAVEAWLLGPERHGVITLPKSALIEEGGYYYVYVKEEDEHDVFRKQEVHIGGFDGERYEILSGLQGGENIAVEGALKIKMAGMGSSIQGHSHHH